MCASHTLCLNLHRVKFGISPRESICKTLIGLLQLIVHETFTLLINLPCFMRRIRFPVDDGLPLLYAPVFLLYESGAHFLFGFGADSTSSAFCFSFKLCLLVMLRSSSLVKVQSLFVLAHILAARCGCIDLGLSLLGGVFTLLVTLCHGFQSMMDIFGSSQPDGFSTMVGGAPDAHGSLLTLWVVVPWR